MALGYRVFSEIERPAKEVLARFAGLPTPDLADVMQKAGVVDGVITPIYQPMAPFVGPAVTVSVPTGSFSVVKIGMEMTRPGDVLVIAARGNPHYALLGGNVCKGLKHRGLAGMIVDGAMRDAEEIQAVDFPVHARALAINAGPKTGPGEVNVPIAFGHCVVFPGDIVVADDEGIAIVPPAHTEEVLRAMEELKGWHASVQPVLERGEVTNIAAIRQALVDDGCEFINAGWAG
jgi:regulator of RNase E activity RraA